MIRPLLLVRTFAAAGLLLATGAALGPAAHAETRRLAVLVGNNVGSGVRPPLAFAENDAQKMASVLVELGGVESSELELLRGRPLATVRAALDRVTARIRQIHDQGTDRVVLVFFFSGHSDGQALELGREQLSFAEVRRWMRDTGADVRLAVIDSCRSGGLIAIKGGRLGPVFDVRLADHLSSRGEAVITSSASSEAALESAEIRGSFFTHHLISGLRGAADASGDGMVTLGEAYQYAFGRTVSATANTLIGPQHPVYDYRLTGRGELVLTRLQGAAAIVETPAGFDRLLFLDPQRQQVVAELGAEGRRRLATRPGSYEVRAWRGTRMYRGQIVATGGEVAILQVKALQPTNGLEVNAKGEASLGITEERREVPPRALGLSIATGLGMAAGDRVDGMPALRFEVMPRRLWSLVLVGATGRGPGFRESHLQVRGGRYLRGQGRIRFLAGAEVGGGLAFQSVDSGRRLRSATGVVAMLLGLEWQATRRLTFRAFGDLPLILARRDGELATLFLPSAWLGVSF